MEKRTLNKSHMVREYLKEHPDAMPSAGAAALKKDGITPRFFSNVKTKIKNDQARIKPSAISRGSRSATQEILAAADLISTNGGVENAQDLVRTAGIITDLLK